MFADACRLANRFTRPVIIFTRFHDKTVKCGCGAFIVLNDEGWILTAAHLWKSFLAYKEHSKQIAEHDEEVRVIQSNRGLDAKQKGERLHRLESNSGWITNHSFWWGWDGVTIKDVRRLPEGDIAVGRLEPHDPRMVGTYPVIKDPTSNLNIGTSLCRLGYPFLQIEATLDEKNGTFELSPGALPLPRFPIEGIYTRNAYLLNIWGQPNNHPGVILSYAWRIRATHCARNSQLVIARSACDEAIPNGPGGDCFAALAMTPPAYVS